MTNIYIKPIPLVFTHLIRPSGSRRYRSAVTFVRMLCSFSYVNYNVFLYNVASYLPSSCHSVGLRLGRQNRLCGGFFISSLGEM